MKAIETGDHLAEALAQSKAILYLHVKWSAPALKSRRVFESFASLPLEPNELGSVQFYLVDLSEQSGQVWDAVCSSLNLQASRPATPMTWSGNWRAVRKWIRNEDFDAGLLTGGGYGSLLWTCHGVVVSHLYSAETRTAQQLLEMTRNAFNVESCEQTN